MAQPTRIMLIICFTVVSRHAAAVIQVDNSLPQPNCTASPWFCEITVPVGDLAFTDSGNLLATKIDKFVFSIFQFLQPGYNAPTPEMPPITNLIVDFDQFNQSQDDPAGSEFIYIRFLDAKSGYVMDTIDKDGNRLAGSASIPLTEITAGDRAIKSTP